jgi:fructose-bisphosphate aldolase, class I
MSAKAQAERGLAAAARRGSGDEKDRVATAHLNAINRLPGPKPWELSFSYGRTTLQDEAMAVWQRREENRPTGISPPGRCNGAATRGE